MHNNNTNININTLDQIEKIGMRNARHTKRKKFKNNK